MRRLELDNVCRCTWLGCPGGLDCRVVVIELSDAMAEAERARESARLHELTTRLRDRGTR
jgi:hypothetical protein